MNRNFKLYAIVWAILLAVFNAVVFLVRPIIPGYTISYDARFWIAWAFIIAAFAGNLACAYRAFKAENLRKLFYGLPLITVSYTGLVLMLVSGGVLMLIPDCPAWIAAVVCVLIFGFTAIAVVKAKAAAGAVESIDTKVKAQTSFIRTLTVNAATLMESAEGDGAKAACRKVLEALRYSDPMSNDALADVENQIMQKFGALSSCALIGSDNVGKLADELVVLIGDRNKKCKLLK